MPWNATPRGSLSRRAFPLSRRAFPLRGRGIPLRRRGIRTQVLLTVATPARVGGAGDVFVEGSARGFHAAGTGAAAAGSGGPAGRVADRGLVVAGPGWRGDP